MRLIDLHVDWLLQYAPESTVFDPSEYPGVGTRLGQAEGYLQATDLAIVACYRNAAEWATQADPWPALGQLLARVEAEFSGRLLIGPDDFDRWRDDRDGMAWGVVGVEGFDYLIRTTAELDRLRALFDRGVRLFQPVYGPDNALGGSSSGGDDRGLTDLGRDFLRVLGELAPDGVGPRPLFDLAHLNPKAASDALAWFEADADRTRQILPIYSHGAPTHQGYAKPRGCTPENLARLRALGGFAGITPSFFASPALFRASLESIAEVPFEGRAGFEGIGIGTDFLGVDRTLPGLDNAGQVVSWCLANFERPTARAIVRENAQGLFARTAGAKAGG